MSGPSTPAGWYPDPQDPTRQRYCDAAGAQEASKRARTFAIVCVVVSIVWTIILVSTGIADSTFEFETS